MNNNIIIYYNNKDIFKDIAPTPFVSISQDYIDLGTKINQITKLTLEGQITGIPYTFDKIYNSTNSLVNDLKDNYKELKIVENGTEIYKANIAIINSINFSEDRWYGILPFSIEFSIYDSNLFQESYGVINPQENYSFEEEEGDFLTFTHNLSAQGIKTETNNAIQNAKNWVNSRKNQINKISPILAKNNSKNFLLQTISEEIDRFNGIYNYTAIYKKNIHPENPNNSFLEYTVETNSGINEGFVLSNINGKLYGNSINILQQDYNNINLYNLCNNLTSNIFNVSLNSKPISQSIEELANENTLTFSSTYNNDFLPNIVNDYTITTTNDPIKCIVESEISAKIFGRYGDNASKWPQVLNFYQNQFFPYSLLLAEYNKDIVGTVAPLNSTPETEVISFNEYNAEINYKAKYNNKARAFSEDILSMSSTVSYNPSILIHVANTAAAVPRAHNVQNLQCGSRGSCSINVTVIAKKDKTLDFARTEAEKQINRLKRIYVDPESNIIRDQYDITTSDSVKSATIQGTWSFNGSPRESL
jgi:hypothetical protein